MPLLTASIAKNSRVLTVIYFIILKNVDQTSQAFNTKLGSQ